MYKINYSIAVLFAALGLAGTVRAETPLPLRLMTYNIQGLPFRPKANFQKLGMALRDLRSRGRAPHVVLMQEAFLAKTWAVADFAGYPYQMKGSMGTILPPRSNSGLLVLSEFPILESHFRRFTHCRGLDCRAAKGVFHMRVSVPGWSTPVDIYTLHMNATSSAHNTRNPIQSDWVRRRQAETLQEFIAETRGDGTPVLLAGDFNFHPGQGAYGYWNSITDLKDAVDSCIEAGKACGKKSFFVTVSIRNQSVDRFFISANGRGAVTPLNFSRVFLKQKSPEDFGKHRYSDHDALMMTFVPRN